MIDYARHFRSGQEAASLEVALGLPVTALLGIDDAAQDALTEIGIASVFDLGASALFFKAGVVAEAGAAGSIATEIGSAPGDWLDAEEAARPLEDLGDTPLGALRELTADQATRLTAALNVSTIRDFAYWPPRRIAHDLVATASGSTLLQAAEPGDELRPRLGEFPTERVYYDRLVMLSHGGPEATAEIDGPIPLDPALSQPFGFGKPAVGALATFSQSWFAKGVTLGQMLHSLALAPGEATRIAVIDWARRTSATARESIDETEVLDSATSHSRAMSEVQNAVATEMQEGESMSSGWASSKSEAEAATGSTGLIQSALNESGSHSYSGQSAQSRTRSKSKSWSSGTKSVVAEMAQNVNDRTEQHSNSVRNRRATAVREVSQSEHEAVSTRIVANYNHMHALTIQYYEVVQVYRVETRLHKAIRCIFLPFEMPDFSDERGRQVIERFRAELVAAALTPRVRNLLEDETANVVLRPVVKMTLPGYGFPMDEAVTTAEMAAAMVPAMTISAPTAGAVEGEEAPVMPASAPHTIIWSGDEIARTSLVLGRQIVRQRSNWIFLPEETQLLGISFSGLNIGSVRTERAGPDDSVFDVPFASARVDLPPGIRLADIDSILVARAANDSLFAGAMTLHCSYLGRPFIAPDIALRLSLGTQMQKVLRLATDRADRRKELQEHLQANATHYGQSILANFGPPTLMSLLSGYRWNGRPVTDVVEPNVIAIAGNYVVLRAPAEADESAGVAGDEDLSWSELLAQRGLNAVLHDARTIPIPTDGVFAEAVLGRSNAAERLDITRFWNWQDSPIPLQPPEISPVGTGSRGTAETLRPGDLGAPVLNIVNPTSIPDPAGLGAGLSALATSNLFRDMSGLGGTQSLASEALGQTTQAASQAGQLASSNLQTEAQKAVAMGQIAADIAKTAMGIPSKNSTDGVSAEGARINQGRDMDQRGVSGPAGSGGASGGSGGGSPSGTSASGGTGRSAGGSSGTRMSSSREAAYADHGALGYSPGGLGALSKLVGDVPLQEAVFGKEDVKKAREIAPLWRNLIEFKVPEDVVDAIKRRGMRVQTLDEGAGDISLDTYPVLISEFPALNSVRVDARGLMEHVRKNLNNFIDTRFGEFLPYAEEHPDHLNPDGTSDSLRWLSGDARMTVFDIDIPVDDGPVVCSAHHSMGWIFSTLEAPDPGLPSASGHLGVALDVLNRGLHPVSGHRGFEIREVREGSGVYVLHTMGADRKTRLAQDPFGGGQWAQKKLWTSFQSKVADFVNGHGGRAEIMDPSIHSISWEIVVIGLGPK